MVENNCGVITTKVRDTLIELSKQYDNKVIFADSRARIQYFKDISIKCNDFEVCRVDANNLKNKPKYEDVIKNGNKLYKQNKKPIFVRDNSFWKTGYF